MSKENLPEQNEQKASELFSDDVKTKEEKVNKPKKISLTAFVCSIVAAALAAVMLTYTICNTVYRLKLADIALSGADSTTELSELEKIFEKYSFAGLEGKDLTTAVLKAYVAATGDKYAEYYTNEEFAALQAEIGGESQGIGINIINSEVEAQNGITYQAFKVINIVPNSPADASELEFGDYIIAVGTLAENITVNALGYDKALKDMQGVKGTYAEFIVYRASSGEFIPFSIIRDEFEVSSVVYRKATEAAGENIGVIKIIEFDTTTPAQVKIAIEALKTDGCDKFVFDVRYNPGGTLDSIVATLSLFLEEGDTLISTKDNAGNTEVTKVAPVQRTSGCSVKKEDIGLYRDINMVVLCNGSTASAAELFVANIRDHARGAIVGTTTYGKGSMQSYKSLAYETKGQLGGYLKLTTHMYYPPCGESYEGLGIEPTYRTEPDEITQSYNTYEIYYTEKDNQLMEAVKHFN